MRNNYVDKENRRHIFDIKYRVKNTFEFLNKLTTNNNRVWFQENKEWYEKSYEEMIHFADELIHEMQHHDNIETFSGKKSLFRIYRDVRFGNDKTPYKTHWAGYLKRATAELRGGYYYQVGPAGSFVMGGFFGPNASDLLHIRKQIALEPDALRQIIDSKNFNNYFGELRGNKLKTAPRGFDKEHPAIDLLRYKQYIVRHDFSKEEVSSNDFHAIVSNAFTQMLPFFSYMSDILTTDLNGRSI